MTDRELLEAAAKAAGMRINAKSQAERDADGYGHVGLWTYGATQWNPLTDDGDALRLAVKMGIGVYQLGNAAQTCRLNGFIITEVVYADEDPLAATRRAIVRAAASIGSTAPLSKDSTT